MEARTEIYIREERRRDVSERETSFICFTVNYIIVPGGIHVRDSKRAEFVLQVLDLVVPV